MNLLGDRVQTYGNGENKSEALNRFLNYLLKLARRKLNEEIELTYCSDDFSLGIILVAKSWKAQSQGASPYLGAMEQKIKQGCETIYFIAYAKSENLLKRIEDVVEKDNRVMLQGRCTVLAKSNDQSRDSEHIHILSLHRNTVFTDTSFKEKVEAIGIVEGAQVEGIVIDVYDDEAIIDVSGQCCHISRHELSWKLILNNCADILSKNDSHDFLVKSISLEKHKITLTRKYPALDPWENGNVPGVNDTVEVLFKNIYNRSYITETQSGVEILVPFSELFWIVLPGFNELEMVGKSEEIIIYEKDIEKHLIKGSVRRTESDPWPEIHRKLLKGTEFHAKIAEILNDRVIVELSDGLVGFVPDSSLKKAGFEFADYQEFSS